MLGYNTPPQTPAKERPHVPPVPIEDAPMYRAALTLGDRPKRATAFNKSIALRRSALREQNGTARRRHSQSGDAAILKYV